MSRREVNELEAAEDFVELEVQDGVEVLANRVMAARAPGKYQQLMIDNSDLYEARLGAWSALQLACFANMPRLVKLLLDKMHPEDAEQHALGPRSVSAQPLATAVEATSKQIGAGYMHYDAPVIFDGPMDADTSFKGRAVEGYRDIRAYVEMRKRFYSVLHIAAYRGQTGIVRTLLSHPKLVKRERNKTSHICDVPVYAADEHWATEHRSLLVRPQDDTYMHVGE